MIEIKFVPNDVKDKICSSLNVKSTPELKIYVAKDKDEVLGCCGFEIHGKIGQIDFTSKNGENFGMIEDGLLRASLAYMYDRFVETAVCDGNVEPKMLKRLGFNEKEGRFELLLSKSFLSSGCGSSGK